MKTKISKQNPKRHWELWTNGRGERVIVHFDVDGSRREVFWLRTRRYYENFKTKIKWVAYGSRWVTEYGEFKSPERAFDKLLSNL